MKLYNSKTNKIETFIPENPNIHMYVCGPTVYDKAHIGNVRPVIVFDLLAHLLREKYEVNFYSNFTDIDDKIIQRAREEATTWVDISATYTDIYKTDVSPYIRDINYSAATHHIDGMLNMIEELIQKGYAYVLPDGHVMFDTTSDYTPLFVTDQQKLISSEKSEMLAKKNKADFVLWKPSSNPSWFSPYGNGRPGWHIECSAIVKSFADRYGFKTLDIHGGGSDLKFPHHQNENSQYESSSGNPLAKYWMHVAHVTLEGRKMSKSFGNIINISDFKHEPSVLKFGMLMTHYRHPLDWSEQREVDAIKKLTKFRRNKGTVLPVTHIQEFFDVLSDDLNTPRAISLLDKWYKQKKFDEITTALDWLNV